MTAFTIYNGMNIIPTILTIFKIALVASGILYLIFAVLVVRQIAVMKRTLITSFSPVITLLGYVHLLMAIMVFLFYLVI